MRIFLAIVFATAINGCSVNGRDTTLKNRPLGEVAEVKRSDKELILDSVLLDILNNPELNDTREFYGTAEDRRIALVTNRDSGFPWPAEYQPILPGWTVSRVEEGAKRNPDQQRLLGVRLDKFAEQEEKKDQLFEAPIEVTILNAGGSKNGAVIGGCSVYFHPKRVGGKWVVKLAASFDP